MFQGLKEWYREPYDAANMSVTRWFLFIGMMLVILAIWKIIVWHLMEV